jgi:hypothetical protein
MPWTVEDVDKHKAGLTPEQKDQWVAVANDALQRCLAVGQDPDQCDVSAIRQADAVLERARRKARQA